MICSPATRLRHALLHVAIIVSLMWTVIGHEATAQLIPGGSCSTTCGCTENYTYSRDGEEKLPLDGKPTKDDGTEFQVVEVGAPNPNAKASGSIAVVEQWSKTPDEILQIEVSKLDEPRKRLYEFLTEGKGTGDTIDERSLLSLGSLVSGPYSGPGRLIPDPRVPTGQSYYTPKLYALRLGSKNCFFETGFERHLMPGTWTERPYSDPPNYPYIRRSILRACIPRTWLRGNVSDQITSYFSDGDYSAAIGIMDFVVGATPFLGTADLIVNQGVLTQVFKGDLESIGNVCGSLSGDIFIAAKAIKAVSGAAKAAKILQVATYSTGAGSVVFTGGYLWSKASEGGLQPFDYGRAALLGIEVVGLITDREAKAIIKGYTSRRYFTRKKPDVAPLTCGPHCVQANKDATPINLKDDLLPVTSAVSRCTSMACKAAPPPQILDGLTVKQIDELIAELPPEIVRREWFEFIASRTKPNKDGILVPTSYLDDGWLNPANAGGMATPLNHIENPTHYGPITPWLSFSDTRVIPDGVERFGETKLFFRVRDFLNDLKKTANCRNVAILTNQQLASYFSERIKATLMRLKVPPTADQIKALMDKLDQLKSAYPLEGRHWKEITAMLKAVGCKSNSQVDEAMTWIKGYMHQGANAEILFYGPVPESYLRIVRPSATQ